MGSPCQTWKYLQIEKKDFKGLCAGLLKKGQVDKPVLPGRGATATTTTTTTTISARPAVGATADGTTTQSVRLMSVASSSLFFLSARHSVSPRRGRLRV